jgi:hypothetical protein
MSERVMLQTEAWRGHRKLTDDKLHNHRDTRPILRLADKSEGGVAICKGTHDAESPLCSTTDRQGSPAMMVPKYIHRYMYLDYEASQPTN